MKMDTIEANAIANTLAESPRCFTQEELSNFTCADEDLRVVLKTINEDSRFIWTREGTTEESIFIAKKALCHWYVGLNIKLARAQKARLSSRKLTLLISSLRLDGQWDVPPTEYIEFGQRYSLVHLAWMPHEYVFPLAHIVSFMTSRGIEIARDILDCIANTPKLELPSDEIVANLVEEVLSILTPRERYVIQRREGLSGNAKMTLEQIGRQFNLTRSRIQQIDAKAWKRMQHPRNRHKLITALLYDIIQWEGSLIIKLDGSATEFLRSFIYRCNGIPMTVFLNTRMAIIGATKENTKLLKGIDKLHTDPNGIATQIDSNNRLPIIKKDVVALAESIYKVHTKSRTKAEKVYLALKYIGRPAHSSEITDIYNYLFPENPSSEHNIRAVLSREQHGVVWIGIRSTFALKELGYEHPSATLFETISEIVQKKFAETSKPVPFAIIAAEVGKYRRVVKPASVTIAAYCNPNLENAYDDYFIPRADNQEEKEISAEKLDEILQKFERRSKRQN